MKKSLKVSRIMIQLSEHIEARESAIPGLLFVFALPVSALVVLAVFNWFGA